MKKQDIATTKKFELGGLSHSAAHHLLAVAGLLKDRGYARVSDIGRELDVTRGSVSVMMQSLKQAGYVAQDDRSFYRLTDEGVQAVAGLRARHEIVERFLVEILGLSAKQSHNESCKLETIVDAPTTRRLMRLLEFWQEHQLDRQFDPNLEPLCPQSCEQAEYMCPCCGLECLDGTCSMIPDQSLDE